MPLFNGRPNRFILTNGKHPWNNQFPETKISGFPVSRRMRGLVYMAFHNSIQYALEKLGKSEFGFERTAVSNFKSKRHEGSGNELVGYSRVPCLGADQKARGLWKRDCADVELMMPSLHVVTFSDFVVTKRDTQANVVKRR